MARTVTADITLTINSQDTDPQGTISGGGDVCTLNYSSTLSYSGTTPGTARSWSTTLSLAGSAQTLDLTSLTGLRGTTETFAKIYALLVVNNSSTTLQNLTVGNAAANQWYAPWSGATVTETVPPLGGRMLKENYDTGWTVDGTHKSLKFDPGAATFTVTVLILGS